MRRRELLALAAGSTCACAPDASQDAPNYRATALSGERFTKDNLKGKVVLIQLWATWCGYCRREQPIIDRLLQEFSGRGLTLLAVNIGESRNTVVDYLSDFPRRPHVVLEKDTNLAEHFRSSGFPAYYLIDREGKVAGGQHGAGGEQALRGLLAKSGLE
jgi:thiol-disulfide isomerase/thioredoxin